MSKFGQDKVQQTTSDKPPVKYAEFSGKEWILTTYNKDTKSKDEVRLTEFVVLSVQSKIVGWSDKHWANLYSQESEHRDGPYTVKEAKNQTVVFQGTYNDNKDAIKALGGKLAKSVTVLDKDGRIVNIIFKGSAATAFGAFEKNLDYTKNKAIFTGHEMKKKGAISYAVPTFKVWGAVTPEDMQEAVDIMAKLYPED